MATPGQLVSCLADLTGIPVGTITLYDRALSEAGYRTKSGRGRSAAQVTSRDASLLLITTLNGGPVKDCLSAVEKFSATTIRYALDASDTWSQRSFGRMAELPRDHNFIDAVATLIDCLHKDPALLSGIYRDAIVEVHSPYPHGYIRIYSVSPISVRYTIDPKSSDNDYFAGRDYHEVRSVGLQTLLKLGRLIYEGTPQ